jgi:hypothetical protein
MDTFTTAKVLTETLRLVKLIAALTGEKMYTVFHRLAVAEHERIQKRQK